MKPRTFVLLFKSQLNGTNLMFSHSFGSVFIYFNICFIFYFISI